MCDYMEYTECKPIKFNFFLAVPVIIKIYLSTVFKKIIMVSDWLRRNGEINSVAARYGAMTSMMQ